MVVALEVQLFSSFLHTLHLFPTSSLYTDGESRVACNIIWFSLLSPSDFFSFLHLWKIEGCSKKVTVSPTILSSLHQQKLLRLLKCQAERERERARKSGCWKEYTLVVLTPKTYMSIFVPNMLGHVQTLCVVVVIMLAVQLAATWKLLPVKAVNSFKLWLTSFQIKI